LFVCFCFLVAVVCVCSVVLPRLCVQQWLMRAFPAKDVPTGVGADKEKREKSAFLVTLYWNGPRGENILFMSLLVQGPQGLSRCFFNSCFVVDETFLRAQPHIHTHI